ncbi:hypothetical protein ACVXHA_30150 [Escherichia coli]
MDYRATIALLEQRLPDRLMPLTLVKAENGVQRDRRNPLIDLCSAECGFDDGGRYGRCGNRCRKRNCGDVRRSLLCRLRFHRRFHCAAFYIARVEAAQSPALQISASTWGLNGKVIS